MRGSLKFNMLSLLLMSAWLLFMGACTTGSKISIESFPSGANVYAKPLGNEVPKLLGQTPLIVTSDEMENDFNGSGPVYIEVEKPAYITEKLFVTEISKVDTLLRFTLTPEQNRKDGQQVDFLIEEILEVKKMVQNKRYETAMNRLKELEKVAPDVSTVYELQGAVYLIQKKVGEALTAYRLAVKYNPQNAEANKMRRFIESNYFGGSGE